MAENPAIGYGDLLRERRRSAGLSQQQLKDRSGIAVRTISDLERGVHKRARRTTAELLANALELTGSDRASFIGLALGHDRERSKVLGGVRSGDEAALQIASLCECLPGSVGIQIIELLRRHGL